MNTLIFFVAIFCFLPVNAQTELGIFSKKSQENPDIEKLEAQKEKVSEKEKHLLKVQVKQVNETLKKNEITAEEAENEKRVAAEKHAQNIEDQHRIIDANISLISRNNEVKDDKTYYQQMKYLEADATDIDKEKTPKRKRRTFVNFIMNMGFSNAIASGKSIGDDYKIVGSRFFDIGYEWSTGLTKNNFLRINYGFSVQFNGLKVKDDQYFVRDGDQVNLEDFGQTLKKAKLRMDNIVIPIHIELGPTNAQGYADRFKFGLGGYAGWNEKTIQNLKYKNNGNRMTRKNYFNSQTEDFIYGLSGYIGYNNWALFVKYDLNPVFKNNEIDEQIIAAGLRIML